MDLLEKASIILTPTASNNGEALCVKPSDGSGDFDFSRNSAATRVNAQGLVENVQILSSNLVQNGDFSEEGAEEVSNGSFSQEGSELITNGNFDTDSDWGLGANWNISNGKANAVFALSLERLQQFNLGQSINRPYKVTFSVSNLTQGSFKVWFGSVQSQTITSDGDYTIYLTPTTTEQIFIYTIGTTTGSIDNFSVREVGQDWTLGTGWSVGEDKAINDGTTGNLDQNNVLTIGNSYKAEFTISDLTTGTLSFRLGGSNEIINVNANGTYTAYGVADGVVLRLRSQSGFDGSITNISVKEVDPNDYWNLGDGWSIGDLGATCSDLNNNLTQNVGATANKNYKVTLDVTEYTSGTLAIDIGGSTNQTATSLGSKTFYFTTTSTGLLRFYGGSFRGTITNISVIEITDDTNLPRINYEGFSYQDALGSELVTNGDFSNGSTDWILNDWTVADGKASLLNGSGFITQNNILEAGKTYKIQYTVSNYVSGTIRWRSASVNGSVNASNGVVTDYITVASSSFSIQGYNNFTGSITNISAKEYLGQEVVPDSGCGSWLFEPQSTNLREQSDTFVGDTKIRGTINNDATEMSPSGLLGVEYLTATAANGLVLDASTATTGDGTFSVYLKRKTGVGDIRMSINGGVSNTTMAVDDTWKRFSLSTTTGLGQLVISCLTSGDEVYIWGWQEEALSYSTSLIPTEGTRVTRNQDVCTNGGSLASINSTEGTLYFEGSALVETDTSNRHLSISSGSNNNRLYFYYSQSGLFAFASFVGGVLQANITYDGVVLNNSKIACKYKENDYALWINGVEVGTDTNASVWSSGTLDRINFAEPNGTSAVFYGKTKAVAVWKEALSDEELTELTTI